VPTSANEKPWLPAVDAGELKFRFLLAPAKADLPRLARELEAPSVVQIAAPAKGDLPRRGSLAALRPASLELLALKRAEDGRGFVVRLRASARRTVAAKLAWLGRTVSLGAVPGGTIASFRLVLSGKAWKASPVDLAEFPKRIKGPKS
ncbi:MAG TPA: hypothetical protein VIM58_07165, partial [Candidatus Methylacidiphilales bacterium]